jgi:hypothetical protein
MEMVMTVKSSGGGCNICAKFQAAVYGGRPIGASAASLLLSTSILTIFTAATLSLAVFTISSNAPIQQVSERVQSH